MKTDKQLKGWLNYARYLVGSVKVNFVFKEGAHPSTDGYNIFLPLLPKVLKKEHYTKLLWWVIHECNHIAETVFLREAGNKSNEVELREQLLNIRKKSVFSEDLLHFVDNAFEDARIDHRRSKVINGSKRHKIEYFATTSRDEVDAVLNSKEDLGQDVALYGMYYTLVHHCGIYSVKPTLDAMDQAIASDPEVEEAVKRAIAAIETDLVELKSDESTSLNSLLIAEKYLHALDLFPKQEPEDEDESESGDQGDESQSGGQGEDESESGDQGDESQSGGQGEGESESGDQGDESQSGGQGEGESESGDQGGESQSGGQGAGGFTPKLKDDFCKDGDEHPGGVNIDDLVKEIAKDESYENTPKVLPSNDSWFSSTEIEVPSDRAHFSTVMASAGGSARQLEYAVEDLLNELVRVKTTFGDCGNFGEKSIGRFIDRKEDVFENRSREVLPTRHLSIVLDSSGSMDGDEDKVILACGMIMRALDILEHTSYSVESFGKQMNVIKRPNESSQLGMDRLGGLPFVTDGGTPMAQALEFAVSAIPDDVDSSDILIITDGCPNDENAVNDEAKFAAENGSFVSILSIGVDPTWANDEYITAKHVSNFANLSKDLIDLFEEILTK